MVELTQVLGKVAQLKNEMTLSLQEIREFFFFPFFLVGDFAPDALKHRKSLFRATGTRDAKEGSRSAAAENPDCRTESNDWQPPNENNSLGTRKGCVHRVFFFFFSFSHTHAQKQELETEQLHVRVRATVSKKDELIASLREELEATKVKVQQQQRLLDRQRTQLVKPT
jgi:hypothetical protein